MVVAVVSWNTRELLDRCLLALRPEADAGRAEVWVVDNGSQDGSPALVRERHAWARLVEPGENLGYGRAVNLLAERTSSPWIAASNADVALRPGALARLLAVVAEHGGNVVDVEHLRDGIDLHVRETAIKLVLQTRGEENGREILAAVGDEGFSVRVERDA